MDRYSILNINKSSIKPNSQALATSNVQFRARFKPSIDSFQTNSTKNKQISNKLKLAFVGFIGTINNLFLNKLTKDEKKVVQPPADNKTTTSGVEDIAIKNNINGYEIPKPLKDTTTIRINGYYRTSEAKFYQKDKNEYAIICGDEYKVEYDDMENAYKRKLANDLYYEASIANPNHMIQKGSEYAILTLINNNEPVSTFDRLNREYHLNLFIDDFELDDNFITFNKNGKETKVEILEDDDIRLTQNSKNKIYISRSEYLYTLRNLSELKDSNMTSDVLTKFLTAKKKIKEEYLRLCSPTKTQEEIKIDNAIKEGIANLEFDTEYQKRLNSILESEKVPKQYQILKNAIEKNPKLKKYILEMYRYGYISSDGAREVTSFVKHNKYVSIDEIRAAAYTKIFQEKLGLTGKEFENLSYIPTKFIAKTVFYDGITDISQIEKLWSLKSIGLDFDLKLRNHTKTQLDTFTSDNIAKYCFNEYGEPCDYKINLAKILLSKPYTFTGSTVDACEYRPASELAKILEHCDTKEYADDIINNILPLLEENEIEYQADRSMYDIITLLNTAPEKRKTKIDTIKYLRKNIKSRIEYNDFLNYKNINTNEYKDLDFNSLKLIVQNAKILPLQHINKEVANFILYINSIADKGVSIYTVLRNFLDDYKQACLENNYDTKKLIIEKINRYLNIANYFIENNILLSTQASKVEQEEIKNLLQKNMLNVLDIIEIAGETTTKHLIERKYKGLKQYIEQASSLVLLKEDQKELLKSKLAELPHPEQRLEKLEAIMPLIDRIKNENLNALIEQIKPPTVTPEQKDKIEQIFSSKKNYSEQINDFIIDFNVPKENEETIRKFLEKEKLNEKFTTPTSIDEQIKVINKKIASIQNNDKIPKDKKQNYLNQLIEQKKQMNSNPNNYTKPKLNDRVMKLIEAQVEAHINLINNNKEFSKNIRKEFYNAFNLNVSQELIDKLEYDSKYMAKLFVAMTDEDFVQTFNALLRLLEKDPSKNLTDLLEKIPENVKTRKLFEDQKLKIDEWLRFDENSYKAISVTVDGGKALEDCKNNFLDEFHSHLTHLLDEDEMYKLRSIISAANVKKLNTQQMLELIEKIELEFKENDYWKQKNPHIENFKSHMEIHKKNLSDIKKLKKQTYNLKVRLWNKNDISRNLGFGNHVGCCTSIGKFNQYVAPQHLMNSFVNGIELVDDSGNSYGNSMCYFAMVDGKLHFIIDSFEVDGNLSASEEVTDAIIDYAKEICARMGRPDAKVIFGPYFNKINSERLFKTPGHSIKVIGCAPEWTYLDALEGKNDINREHDNLNLSEIMY